MLTALSVNKGGLGRFGNQCFTIAATIGLAMKSNQPFGFLAWRTADNALFGDPVDNMSDYLVNPLPSIPEGMNFIDVPYHWEYREQYYHTGNWNICSHLQDPRYFEDYMPLIRHYFRMKDEPAQNDLVAIHYRAGDYINDPNAYHPRCSSEYYNKAMLEFPSGTKFMIYSDDPDEAEKVIGRGHNIYFPTEGKKFGGNYLDEFRTMKRCEHFITANSSFSLFAAILGEHPDKKIICPRRWFGTAAGGLEFTGYPKNAIVI